MAAYEQWDAQRKHASDEFGEDDMEERVEEIRAEINAIEDALGEEPVRNVADTFRKARLIAEIGRLDGTDASSVLSEKLVEQMTALAMN